MKKFILVIFLLIIVKITFAVSFGPLYTNSTDISYRSTDALSSTKFVTVYKENSTNRIYAKIGEISGTTITYAEPKLLITETGNVTIKCVALTSDAFAVVYRHYTASYAKMCLCTVSGTTISISRSLYNFESFNLTDISATKLTDTSFLIFYKSSSARYSRVVTTNSTYTSTSLGTSTSWSSDYTFSVAKIFDSSKFIISYGGTVTYCRIGTISGTTITYGMQVQALSAFTYSDILITSGTNFIVSFATGNYVGCRYGTVSGTTITYGTVNYAETSGSYFKKQLIKTTSDYYLVVSNIYLITINGTDISYTTTAELPDEYNVLHEFYSIGNDAFLVSINNATLSGVEYNGIMSFVQQGKKINGITYSKWNGTAITKFNNQ